MKAVILGGTKGMGRELARRLAERGDSLFLLGRSIDDLARSASDLRARGAANEVGTAKCDLLEPSGFGGALDRAWESLGGADLVVVTAGLYATQERLEEDDAFRREMLDANFRATIEFCEQARRRLLEAGGGTLCVFSSVAGERGRKPTILYGATKAGLSYYLEALDHRYRSEGLATVCVKPGFVRTGMTAGLEAPPFAGEPEGVSHDVLRAIDRRQPVVFTPPIWRLVMAVIRALPRAVMRRVGF